MDDESSVDTILDTIRPAMQADGGDVQLVSVQGGIVSVRLKGMCLLCPSANMTLKHGIERTLRQHLPWVEEVKRVP
jgi:Fe-S cluster biogenesis protein NfuA